MDEYILAVDDDSEMLETLKGVMASRGFVLDAVQNGEDGIRRHEERRADLILLDIAMPRMDGFQFIQYLRLRHDPVPILVLSARNLEHDRISGMRYGADDYLAKPFSPDELAERIRAILRRTTGKNPAMRKMASGPFLLDPITFTVSRARKHLDVSMREFRILEVLLSAHPQVLSRRTLVNSAWDYDARPTLRTVDYHVVSLRRKLGLVNNAHPIKTVEGEGFCWMLPVKAQ